MSKSHMFTRSSVLVCLASLLVLALVNHSIYQKEQHIEHGAEVLLKLAPVDPRSLMQGDYMALRFDMQAKIMDSLPKADDNLRWRRKTTAKDGVAVVRLDANRVAELQAIGADQFDPDVQKLKYRVRNGSLKFATNAFFFQEGTARHFENAKYGVFRVDSDGELLLVDLADEKFNRIKQSLLPSG